MKQVDWLLIICVALAVALLFSIATGVIQRLVLTNV
jgi:hypothetical protein